MAKIKETGVISLKLSSLLKRRNYLLAIKREKDNDSPEYILACMDLVMINSKIKVLTEELEDRAKKEIIKWLTEDGK
jgi:hypothetical protein